MIKKWRVLVTSQCEVEINRTKFTDEERFIIASWIRFVEEKGPYLLSEFKDFEIRDHALVRQRKWHRHRSSSFSRSGRIIYKIDDQVVTIIVVRITKDHDYR